MSKAQRIQSAHLGEQTHRYTTSGDKPMSGPVPFHGPSGGEELFSGSLDGEFEMSLTSNDAIQRAVREADPGPDDSGDPQGNNFPGGTRASHTRGNFAQELPDLVDNEGISWWMGAPGQRAEHSMTLGDLVYERHWLSGGPFRVSAGVDYTRRSDNEPWYSSLNSSDDVRAEGRSFELSGTHELRSRGDGEYLAELAESEQGLSTPWEQLLLEPWSEGIAFAALLAEGRDPGSVADGFYAWARQGIWGGSDARSFLASDPMPGQLAAAVHSLQEFEKLGSPLASRDLMEMCTAAREVLADPSVPESTKEHLRNEVQSGMLSDLLEMSLASFPVEEGGEMSTDTPDGSTELARLAGLMYTQSSLLPRLASTLDPEAFIDAFPIPEQPDQREDVRPEQNLLEQVIAEAQGIEQQVETFFAQELTPENVAPSTSYGRVPQPTDAEQQALNDQAVKVGGAEALAAAGAGSSITRSLGIGLGLKSLHAQAPSGGGGPVSLAQVLNLGVSSTNTTIHGQGSFLRGVGEGRRNAAAADSAEHLRGQALYGFGNSVAIYNLTEDVASLRSALGAMQQQITGDIARGDITTWLATQANIGMTHSIMALQTSLTRGREDLIRNIQGQVSAQAGGVPWVATGMLALNTIKELVGFYQAAREFGSAAYQAGRGLKFAGPVLAVVSFALDAFISIHDSLVKEALGSTQGELINEATTALSQFESQALGAVRTQAGAEQRRYAAGTLRTTDNASGFFGAMQRGESGGSLGRQTSLDLNSLNANQLQALYADLIACQGVPYNEVFQGAQQNTQTTIAPMWRNYQSQIQSVGSTIGG